MREIIFEMVRMLVTRRPTLRRLGQLTLAVAIALTIGNSALAISSLKVMTYNIYVGGAAYGPLSRTVGVIQTAQADVIGIQEVGGSAQAIANALGFYYHGFDSDLAIISRYPIAEVLSEGVRLKVSPTQDAYLFNVHLSAYPYQPYDIRDGKLTTEAQAITAAQSARGAEVTSLLNATSLPLATGLPVFLTGDFNEPSHLDWTQAAASAGLHFGKKVDWPASHRVVNAGFADAFRELRPDVINDRGNTWTPGSPAPTQAANEVYDRIDFVYHAGAGVTPQSATIYGYDANDPDTDVGIQPYPSDHRSVVVQFNLPACTLLGDLNGNCSVGVDDWQQFRSGQLANLTGLTASQAYAMGDLNGDKRNDHADFVLFKSAYDATNGAGAFIAMVDAVPEPATGLLLLLGALAAALNRPRR